MKHFKTLIPEIVADGVSREYSDKLMSIFSTLMKNNRAFNRRITDTTDGRDRLWAFMDHWFMGYRLTGKWLGEEK